MFSLTCTSAFKFNFIPKIKFIYILLCWLLEIYTENTSNMF